MADAVIEAREHYWLAEMDHTIKKARNERLFKAFSLRDKKAASDPDVGEALRLLRPWASGQEQDDETTSNGI